MRRTKQVHFWISSADYQFIVEYAEKNDITVAVLMRLLIRRLQMTSTTAGEVFASGERAAPLAKSQKAS